MSVNDISSSLWIVFLLLARHFFLAGLDVLAGFGATLSVDAEDLVRTTEGGQSFHGDGIPDDDDEEDEGMSSRSIMDTSLLWMSIRLSLSELFITLAFTF